MLTILLFAPAPVSAATPLTITKTAPGIVAAGDYITYTLTITNTSSTTDTTDLVITDTMPANAHYVSGGTRVGNIVGLTLAQLLRNTITNVEFIVTATQDIVNDDYRVSCAEDYSATNDAPVTTQVYTPVAGLAATSDSPTELGQNTTLTATVTAGSSISYTWDFGGGITKTGRIVTYTYAATGVHTALVTATNPVNEMTATTTVTVDEAIAGLTATNDSPTELGNETALTATITAGSNVTYTWAFGDGEFGSGAEVTHTYTLTGFHTAIVTAANSVGFVTATTVVSVDKPITGLVAINDSPTVLNTNTTLTATITDGTNVTYTWAFGDGEFGSGAEVTHTYATTGVHVAVVTATNSLGFITATTVITVDETIAGLVATNDSPTPWTARTTLTATVTAGSNISYTWNFGDGEFGSGAVVTHIFTPSIDIYTATVTATNSVSQLTATTVVTIVPRFCWARIEGQPDDFLTVQAAIDASAFTTDVIKVAGYCSATYDVEDNVQIAYISKTLTLRGGYTFTNWTVSNPISYPTTLDAQETGRVIYVTGAVSPTIENFLITEGDAGSGADGGGIYIEGNIVNNPHAIIRNNEIFSNTARSGGGVYVLYGDSELVGNTIFDNVATSTTSANRGGGGIYLYGSDGATIESNFILTNTANNHGGGAYLWNSDAILTGNTIADNIAVDDGGGIRAVSSLSTLHGNQLFNNNAERGSGLFLSEDSNSVFINNVIANNRCSIAGEGGGLYLLNSNPTMSHTTISGNSGGDGSGIRATGTSAVTLTNTILVSQVIGVWVANNAEADLDYTLWHSNTTDWAGADTIITGTQNYWGDPAFFGSVLPYHIRIDSAARDRGIDVGVTDDIDGEARPQGDYPDLGADEWYMPVLTISKLGPSSVLNSHSPITYAITVSNTGPAPAYDLLITDTIPDNATYLSGGTRIGNIVSWTVDSLAANDFVRVRFSVSTTWTISNYDYRVSDNLGHSATGAVTVETYIGEDPPISGLKVTNDSPTARGDTTEFTATILIGARVTYTWNFGDGSAPVSTYADNDQENRVTHTYPAPDIYHPPIETYTAIVTVENSVSLVTATTTVTLMRVLTDLQATNDSPTVLGDPTALIATMSDSTGVTYSWDFGDGEFGSSAAVTHTYANVGYYTATVTAANAVSSISTTTPISVQRVISGLTAMNDSPTALGEPTELLAILSDSTDVTFSWDFGDGDVSSGQTVTHTYPNIGNYTAVVTAENLVSLVTATTQITIQPVLTDMIAQNDSPTAWGEPTELLAVLSDSDTAIYSWAFGDGAFGAGKVVTHTYPDVGSYTAIVTAENAVSVVTATTSITVQRIITGLTAMNDSPTTLGEATELLAILSDSADVAFSWDFGDGEFGGGAVASHTYQNPQIYTATVTAINLVSSMTATTAVTVDEAISGLAIDSETWGTAVTLTASIGAGSSVVYDWDFGDKSSGSGAGVTHDYAAPGTYTIVVTASNSVSLVTTTLELTVDELISGLVAMSDAPTVLGSVTTLSATIATGSNVSYTWDLGDGALGSGAVVNHTYSPAGVYTATVTASNLANTMTATTLIMVDSRILSLSAFNYSPTVLGNPTEFVAGVTAGSNVSFEWAFDDGEFGSGAEITHTYAAAGEYTALVTASNSVSVVTRTTIVNVDEPLSGLAAVNDSPTALGDATTFTATVTAGSNVSYDWTFAAGQFGNGAVMTYTYPTVGTHTATVIASNSVSSETVTTQVTVEELIAGLVASNDSPTKVGEVTTLTATITAGSNVTYTWAFGDGEFGSGAVVTHTYPAIASYTATVTASNRVGVVSADTLVTIEAGGYSIFLPIVMK